MKIFIKLSEIVYPFIMDKRASDYRFFQNGHGYGNGMEYIFIALLVIPLLFCLLFYFVQARELSNGTQKNYNIFYLLGLFTMLVVDFVIMCFVAKGAFFSGNLLKVMSLNVVYYTFLYQLYSWLMRGISNVPHVDLLSNFSKK